MIRKANNKYVLWSKTVHEGHRRHLGTFNTLKEAVAREKQIEYFKNKEKHRW